MICAISDDKRPLKSVLF